jgi:hypothetical protein
MSFAFRSAQPHRKNLPKTLWQAAVELARQHGVYSVAHPLRLDYAGLNKRLDGIPDRKKKAGKPAFVELISDHSATMADFVRSESPSDGVRLVLQAPYFSLSRYNRGMP